MKRLFPLLLGLGLTATTALAMPPGGPDGHGPRHGPPPPAHVVLLHHADDLQLDDAVLAEAQALADARKPRLDDLHEQLHAHRMEARELIWAGADRETLHAHMEAGRGLMDDLRTEHKALADDVFALLTDAQRAQLEALKPERGERGERGDRSERGPRGPRGR